MAETGTRAKRFSVSEITFLVKTLLEEEFQDVTVEGEISNFRPASSGHWYFSLKDQEAILSAVMFRGRSERLPFRPTDGMLVRARGNLSVYPKRGNYQLICEELIKAGEGDILAMLEERKRRLAEMGLFAAERKRTLPAFPSRVAVVTSPTGAAIRDILQVLRRRNAGLDLVILPAPVQGDGAAEIIARRIATASRFRMGDVLIVARGGGSLEDLLPFSDERVVMAIAESTIPVISAIGHEIDVTLSDYAADVRAPTPSAAAEIVSASRVELLRRVRELEHSLRSSISVYHTRAHSLVGQFTADNLIRNLQYLVQPLTQGVDGSRQDLVDGIQALLLNSRHRLEVLNRTIEAHSPLEILRRGYAVVTRADTGQVLVSARSSAVGDDVVIRLYEGRLKAGVKEIEDHEKL